MPARTGRETATLSGATRAAPRTPWFPRECRSLSCQDFGVPLSAHNAGQSALIFTVCQRSCECHINVLIEVRSNVRQQRNHRPGPASQAAEEDSRRGHDGRAQGLGPLRRRARSRSLPAFHPGPHAPHASRRRARRRAGALGGRRRRCATRRSSSRARRSTPFAGSSPTGSTPRSTAAIRWPPIAPPSPAQPARDRERSSAPTRSRSTRRLPDLLLPHPAYETGGTATAPPVCVSPRRAARSRLV